MKSIYIYKIEDEGLSKYLPEVNMSDRDKEIVVRYLEEKPTYQTLANAYEISGERVRQILEKFARKANHISRKEGRMSEQQK